MMEWAGLESTSQGQQLISINSNAIGAAPEHLAVGDSIPEMLDLAALGSDKPSASPASATYGCEVSRHFASTSASLKWG